MGGQRSDSGGLSAPFAEFAREHADGLLRYATVLCCDPYLAQDIVQEVLLRAAQQWGRISAVELPAAYVKRMVTNEFLSLRRRRALQQVSVSDETIEVLGGAADDPFQRIDERDAMLARIAALPRKQRAAVVLRYYERCSDAEIAESLGCSQVTVRTHLHRAVRALRAAHAEEELRTARGVSWPATT